MLGECHAHIILDGKNYKEAVGLHKNGVVEEVIHRRLKEYQAAGISFIRDGGDCYGVSKRAKELSAEYGITYLTPIFAIHQKGRYGSIVGREFTDLREYQELVKEVKVQGGDFIKIMISGLIDFTEFGKLSEEGVTPELIREMIHIAHEEGMAVMTHCNGAKTIEAAAQAGVDSIEHGAYSDEDALQAMAENQVLWTPTVSPIGNLKGGGRFEDTVTEKITKAHLNSIQKFVNMGGHISLGSDAGAWRVPHVEGLRTELAYLKEIVEESHLEETEKMLRQKFMKKE